MSTKKPAARAARTNRRAPAAPAAPDKGYIEVRVGKLPGMIQTIGLNGGRKVKDALAGANLEASGYEIKVNAAPATLETDLKWDDTVLLVRKIKGN